MSQINLGGSVGVPGSVYILGNYNVVFPSDADYTMLPSEFSNSFLDVTSAISLTATRELIGPLNQGQAFVIQNNTTGGQSIIIIGSSGTGVTIPNGSTYSVVCDGTNYLMTSGASVGPPYTITVSTLEKFVEIGQVVVNPIFNATYSQTPTTATFSDNVGNTPENVFTAPPPSIPPDTFAYNNNYQYNTASSVVFTLASTYGSQNASATTTIYWNNPSYYGVAVPGGPYNAAFIQSLTGSQITGSIVSNFTVNAGAGQAVYFACRSAFGTPDFWVGGWEGGFNLVASSVAVTNSQGFTENYDVYQTTQLNLGKLLVYVF